MYEIDQVVPHSAPMILLDKLVQYDITSATCAVKISNKSPFYCENTGGVPSYVGVEYMAQAIAAYAGALALDANEDVKVGFLLGSRKYKASQAVFLNGQTLSVDVEKLYEEESGLRVFNCAISIAQEEIVSAKLNVFQPADAEGFIGEQE